MHPSPSSSHVKRPSSGVSGVSMIQHQLEMSDFSYYQNGVELNNRLLINPRRSIKIGKRGNTPEERQILHMMCWRIIMDEGPADNHAMASLALSLLLTSTSSSTSAHWFFSILSCLSLLTLYTSCWIISLPPWPNISCIIKWIAWFSSSATTVFSFNLICSSLER